MKTKTSARIIINIFDFYNSKEILFLDIDQYLPVPLYFDVYHEYYIPSEAGPYQMYT